MKQVLVVALRPSMTKVGVFTTNQPRAVASKKIADELVKTGLWRHGKPVDVENWNSRFHRQLKRDLAADVVIDPESDDKKDGDETDEGEGDGGKKSGTPTPKNKKAPDSKAQGSGASGAGEGDAKPEGSGALHDSKSAGMIG